MWHRITRLVWSVILAVAATAVLMLLGVVKGLILIAFTVFPWHRRFGL